uniref:Uncharacterized protein n=1 Tax=Steinernema glaseri TaxID=37863 RepID=A0A1I7YN15_9BILA
MFIGLTRQALDAIKAQLREKKNIRKSHLQSRLHFLSIPGSSWSMAAILKFPRRSTFAALSWPASKSVEEAC